MSIVPKVVKTLQGVFGSCAESANEETKVIKRRRKFTPQTLAAAFILALLRNPKANSEQIAAMAAASGVVVSHQAVEQRYSPELAEFFKILFSKMTQQVVHSNESLAPILERFSEVNVIDSSMITLPDSQQEEYQGCGGSYEGGKAALKLQTELNLRNGDLRCVQIEPGRSPDAATDRQQIVFTKGSLRLADLGYFNIRVFQEIDRCEAYYLSRVQHQTKIYVGGVKYDLVPWLNSLGDGVIDQQVEIGSTDRLGCRLIAWRVPEEVANRRRQKLIASTRKKHGRQPTAASLAACDWEFLVTNLLEDQLTIKEAIVLYRARWQIELLFKRWKSHCQIDELDGRNDIIQMTRFWARLCAMLIQHWLSIAASWSSTLRVSLGKTAKLTRDFAKDMAIGLSDNGYLTTILERFRQMAHATCKLTKRKKKPATLDQLRDPDQLEYVLT